MILEVKLVCFANVQSTTSIQIVVSLQLQKYTLVLSTLIANENYYARSLNPLLTSLKRHHRFPDSSSVLTELFLLSFICGVVTQSVLI